MVHGWLGATGTQQTPSIPLALRLHDRVTPLRDLLARVFGLGVWPVRLELN
jgi:hypothetical protein